MDKIKTLDQAKTQLENLVLTLRHDGYSDDVDALSVVLDTLNSAADKDRQIAVLTEALGHYGNKDTWAPSAPVTNDMDDRDYDQLIKDFYLNDGHGYDIAAEALAKSKRIQEGE